MVFHNRPQSGAVYEPVSQRLLPLDVPWAEGLAKIPWPNKSLPEIVGGDTATLRALIREYLFISLFRACAESLASENASRLAAMQPTKTSTTCRRVSTTRSTSCGRAASTKNCST